MFGQIILSAGVVLTPLVWLSGRAVRRRLAARAVAREEADRVEHARLTEFLAELNGSSALAAVMRRDDGSVILPNAISPQLCGTGRHRRDQLTSRPVTG